MVGQAAWGATGVGQDNCTTGAGCVTTMGGAGASDFLSALYAYHI